MFDVVALLGELKDHLAAVDHSAERILGAAGGNSDVVRGVEAIRSQLNSANEKIETGVAAHVADQPADKPVGN